MAIHTIDNITIDGRNKAFGGNIYAVDFQLGILDEPSSVVVTFINESGDYLEPELSFTKPYKIKIGNILDDKFYATTRKIEKSSGGRTLEVTFVDGSSKLDRIWVGLHKRMGDENTDVPGLLIVGKEIHPCDADDSGQFDSEDYELLLWQGLDPCELRCPASHNETESIIESCIQKEIQEIFDVKYSFSELLDALEGTVDNSNSGIREISYPVEKDLEAGVTDVSVALPAIKKNPNPSKENRIKIRKRPSLINDFYKTDYTGTLREVLRNWCADFGWTFTWEAGELVFLDTKERPQINYPQDSSALSSFTDIKTLEGTVARGYVSTYLKPGIKAEQECDQSRPLLLHCLNLRDLYGEFYKPSWGAVVYRQDDYRSPATDLLQPSIPDPQDRSPDGQVEYLDTFYENGVPIENFEISCVCAKYSSELRHLYNLWNYYGITSVAEAEAAKGKWMDRLGQIKILSVLSSSSTGGNKVKFDSLLSQDKTSTGGSSESSATSFFNKEDSDSIRQKNGYIIIALRKKSNKDTSAMLEKQVAIEERIANDFLGRHWYRAYTSPFYGESPSIFPNGQYLGALSTNIEDLPFAAFNHTSGSTVSRIVSAYVQRQSNDFRQFGALKFSRAYKKNTAKKNVRSIIYFNRSNGDMWEPSDLAETKMQALLQDASEYAIRRRDLSNETDDTIKTLVTENGVALARLEDYDRVEVLVVYPKPGEDALNISSSVVEHPNKEFPQHTEGVEPFALATAGMLSNQCVGFLINGVKIYSPVGASVRFGDESERFAYSYRQPVTRDFSRPTYKVYVTSSVKNRGRIDKTEISIIDTAPLGNAQRVEYKTNPIDKDSVRWLNQLTTDCTLDPEKIQQVHERTAANLNFSVVKPFRSIQYSVFGLTTSSDLKPSKGLESLSVRIDGDGGVITSVTLSDKLFTPPSQDFILRAINAGIDPKLAKLSQSPLL